MLSNNQLQNICLYNTQGSAQCRYLEPDDVKFGVWYCKKKNKEAKKNIDSVANKFIDDSLKKGIDPYQGNKPLGDNCSGYPKLNISQGYDV